MVTDIVSHPPTFDWFGQLCHKHWMPLDTTLEEAYDELLSQRLNYSVLLNADMTVRCMVSFQRLANVLSLRYGQELYAHAPVDRIKIPARLVHGSEMIEIHALSSVAIAHQDILYIRPDTDLMSAVRRFNERTSEHYFDDLVIVDASEKYCGLLSAIQFNRIHTQFTKTQEKKLEDQNHHLMETLGHLSRTQSELISKSKMASLGELIAGIAHEMNTPLGVLLSSHEIIEMGIEKLGAESDPQKSGRIRTIISENKIRAAEAGARVSAIIHSLKVFGRNATEEMFPADLNHIVSSTLTLLGNSFKSGMRVRVESLNGPCMADCHADQIGQVFLNILNNAIQAMDGKGLIEITVARGEEFARVSIRDTGPGVPPAIQERIFDPGYTTKGVGVGTGLGLSISRKIVVENHQGRISVKNHPQGGAVFDILLPFQQTPHPNHKAIT